MKHLIASLTLSLSVSSAFAADRSYVSGNFFLSLDGVRAGFIKTLEGGGIEADVASAPPTAVYPFEKHISSLRFPEICLTVDPVTAAAFAPWIESTLLFNYVRKNGEISTTSPSLGNQQFFNALLTEVGVPACDASSRDPAYMTIKFAPEYTRHLKGSGPAQPRDARARTFNPAAFRLEIDGLDCSRVSKVDAFTIKQKVVELGDVRDYVREPGKLEIPNLRITLEETSAASWFGWFEKFVLNGNNDESQEKDGRLIFLGPNMRDVLLEVRFYNLGIFKLTPDKSEANSDSIQRLSASLYVEQMKFTFSPESQ